MILRNCLALAAILVLPLDGATRSLQGESGTWTGGNSNSAEGPFLFSTDRLVDSTNQPVFGNASLRIDAMDAERLVTTTLATFPESSIVANPAVGANPGSTRVSPGNSRGQSFSLAGDAKVSAFVLGIGRIVKRGTYRLSVARGMDHLPWLAPALTSTGTLPLNLPATGGLIRIILPAPLALTRGTWTVTISENSADFEMPVSNAPLFPSGALIRKNQSTGNRWAVSTNPDSDLVFAVLGTQQAPPPPPAGKPNIIFILADDLGWTDIRTGGSGPNVIDGVNLGSDFYQTPNLARLAAEGLSFTHCHMMPNCSPTRAALLSGQYPSRSGNGVYVVDDLNRGDGTPPMIAPPQNEDVPAAQVTHAEALAAVGYVNAHFGKFHVGGHEGGTATLPLNQGFEMNFGGGSSGYTRSYFASGQKFGSDIGPELDLWAGNYTPAYLETILKGPPSNPLHQRAMSPNLPDLILSDGSSNHGANKHLTDSMGDAALAFLNDHRRGALQDHPFFMQFHFQAVHLPIQPRWDLLRKYAELPAGTYHSSAPYAALLENMDQTVGRILDWLDDPNGDGNRNDSISENTLLIFTSDNGGLSGDTNNAPLRGSKGTFWEGGLRVPLIVRRPGTVPAGRQTDTLVHAVDFYPTMLEHAGVPLPSGITFDGTSFASHMTNPAANPRDREPIFYHFPGYLDNRARPCSVAIRRFEGKDYKLIYNYDLTYRGDNPPPEGLKVLSEPWELYNLTDDIEEARDLIDGTYSNHLLYGAIADSLAGSLRSWLTQPGADWNAKQPTDRPTGATVPLPPGEVPDVTVPFEQQFKITSSTVDSTARKVTLRWNSESGFSYDIQASGDLANWQTLGAGISATGSSTSLTMDDLQMDANHPRFYRVVLRPD